MVKDNNRKRIAAIQFGLLSPKEIRQMSAVEVMTADTCDDDGRPIDRGLLDERMGVFDKTLRCLTCQNKEKDCPGHFGHIELAMPIIHVGFAKKIRDVMRATCRSCGKLVFTEGARDTYQKRLQAYNVEGRDPEPLIKEIAKQGSGEATCPHCKRAHGAVELDKPTAFRYDNQRMTASEVREWLEKVPNEDLPLTGLNPDACRPEWMVLTVLPVPPVTVRPSINLDTGERQEDDLTHKLADIIKANQKVRNDRDSGSPQLIIEDTTDLLQYHITTYIDNTSAGVPVAQHRHQRPLKTLSQRLKGKEGRFRSNLSGKRVNFSARTVISPDPNLSINEVGVPVECARELTVPIRVTPANFSYCQELVLRGPEPEGNVDKFYKPGVNYISRADGFRVKVTNKTAPEQASRLTVGSVVERQLDDGDVVLFNRQPTLHRMSMMAHSVRVMPGKTFRFNLPCCPPYNADFDGDEMNLHVIQGEEARAEAELLIKVQENIRSPRFGGSIIGAIHDHISGNFLMTWKNPKIALEDATQVLARVGFKGQTPRITEEKDARGEIRRFVYGKDLFSTLLPDDLNLEYNSKATASRTEAARAIGKKVITDEEYKQFIEDEDFIVRIHDGKLITGGIDERSIASFKGTILDTIARRHGNTAARIFLDKVTKMGNGFLTLRGFTTSIDDEDIPEDAVAQIKDLASRSRAHVEELILKERNGKFEVLPGQDSKEALEKEILNTTNGARNFAGDIVAREVGMTNSAVLMAKCGARGNMMNLSQMAGLVGQQSVRGSRIVRGYKDRTLPHFNWGDMGADARGFVGHSYKQGLTPTEYFFHSMGGREGLVDTAVRTSQSGYLQRRLINALEDLKVAEDGTVRNTAGTIVQFTYGEDGVDPTRSKAGQGVDFEWVFREMERRKQGGQ